MKEKIKRKNKTFSKNRRGQEEMVGFALIVIIVAVILLAFLGFSLNKTSQSLPSYGAQSFVQSMLQTSTQCQNYYGYVSVQDLMSMCISNNQQCNDGNYSCTVLNSTLEGILNQSWQVGQGSPIKGYELNISSDNGFSLNLNAGNVTSRSEGTYQDLSPSGVQVSIQFTSYY